MHSVSYKEKTIREHLEKTISRLNSDDVITFKIGITEDLSKREQAPDYQGYKLFTIAIGRSDQIRNAEKAAICFFKESSVANKCENNPDAGGSGQVENANHLYIAIKEKQMNSDDLVFYPIEI